MSVWQGYLRESLFPRVEFCAVNIQGDLAADERIVSAKDVVLMQYRKRHLVKTYITRDGERFRMIPTVNGDLQEHLPDLLKKWNELPNVKKFDGIVSESGKSATIYDDDREQQ